MIMKTMRNTTIRWLLLCIIFAGLLPGAVGRFGGRELLDASPVASPVASLDSALNDTSAATDPPPAVSPVASPFAANSVSIPSSEAPTSLPASTQPTNTTSSNSSPTATGATTATATTAPSATATKTTNSTITAAPSAVATSSPTQNTTTTTTTTTVASPPPNPPPSNPPTTTVTSAPQLAPQPPVAPTADIVSTQSPVAPTGGGDISPLQFEIPTDPPVKYVPPKGEDPVEEETKDEPNWDDFNEDPEQLIKDPLVIVLLSLVFVIMLLFTIAVAHQLLNNPDGCCASICRLCVACTCCLASAICFPCRRACGCDKDTKYSSGAMNGHDTTFNAADLELT